MKNELVAILENMKKTRSKLSGSSDEQRRALLVNISQGLLKDKEILMKANQIDLDNLDDGILKKRLVLDDQKIEDLRKGLIQVSQLEDPIGHVLEKRKLDDGLILSRISVSMGTICMIFESRPEALVQITSLCLRSGNAVILKGGKEAVNTNQALFDSIKRSISYLEKDNTWIALIKSRNEVDEILGYNKLIDLVVPRGSNALVQHVMDNTRIPVLGHSSGLCSIYVDRQADIQKALNIALDGKITYPAACNAVETILVHQDVAKPFIEALGRLFGEYGITIHADSQAHKLCPGSVEATSQDWDTEYLSLQVALKVVKDIDEAIDHINTHGSSHTDVIISQDQEAIRTFEWEVDSAGVYSNASPRFADGYRYGLGAEVGICTSKLHARGPVGLRGLMTEKWILEGSGQVSATYCGKDAKAFLHEDLI